MDKLLAILRIPIPQFPKDSRTLLQTPTSCPYKIINVFPGFYCHIGIQTELRKILNNSSNMDKIFEKNSEVVLPIDINIDGLPLSNSSKSQFWPILLSIDIDEVSKDLRRPFAVGIYHGYQKPYNVDEFLNDFITEFQMLKTQGFEINQKIIKLKISKLICDAPAKLFVLCIKGHTDYSSCTKCI